MCGICGNLNGLHDDFALSNGTDVSHLGGGHRKYTLIGNSWQVDDVENEGWVDIWILAIVSIKW